MVAGRIDRMLQFLLLLLMLRLAAAGGHERAFGVEEKLLVMRGMVTVLSESYR